MADLENLLLEAAGRTGRNRNSIPPSRRGRDDGYSDGGTDSREDDSDGEIGYAGRKPSGSQVPLKKRLDPAERDDNEGSQEEGGDDVDGRSDHEDDSSSESNIGDDLYKNEDDRRKLSEMTELEREMILSDRASKKDDKNLLGKIVSKREKGKASVPRKQTPPLPSSRVRSSARSADRSTAKDDALNELRAKRLKQQDSEANRKMTEASGGSGTGFLAKHRPFTSTGFSSSSQSESESGSHSDDERIVDSDDDRALSGFEGPSFEDIKEITIPRSKLAKWFMEPFFEELIVGCFVRVGIGRSKSGAIYRLCMVKNVDATDPDRQYKLENRSTHKYLNLVWGNETSAARWQMAMVSDSPPREEEFKQWLKELERTGGRMPIKRDVLDKKQAIKKINTFVYSAATVKQMLQEKKSASSRPLNVAAEKDRLRNELEKAILMHNEAEVERIRARLHPAAIHELDSEGKNIVLLAIENRHIHLYQLLLKRNMVKDSLLAKLDYRGNTALHLAAKLGAPGYTDLSRRNPIAALQMHWEIKWYKFILRSGPPRFFLRYNNAKQTPAQIFAETHRELGWVGCDWLQITSGSCSLLASLIATVAFATSTTVPGGVGDGEDAGIPNFIDRTAYKVFSISSLIALGSSINSLVLFLSILASRCHPSDFEKSLPRKLILGLTSMFLSIISMLASFCAAHFLGTSSKLRNITVPIYALSCLPLTYFALSHFPLYIKLFWSTIHDEPQDTFDYAPL